MQTTNEKKVAIRKPVSVIIGKRKSGKKVEVKIDPLVNLWNRLLSADEKLIFAFSKEMTSFSKSKDHLNIEARDIIRDLLIDIYNSILDKKAKIDVQNH